MTDKLEAFLADYEDRLGRWHNKGDMYELGFKMTALVRAYREAYRELCFNDRTGADCAISKANTILDNLPEPTDE